MKVRIEYCVPCNYEPRALRARARLLERGAEEVVLG